MAPAKSQNNGAQAAKPKSGAKNLRNVRPGAAGHTECHLTEGLSSAGSESPAFSGLPSPGFTRVSVPQVHGDWMGTSPVRKAQGLFGSPTCLVFKPWLGCLYSFIWKMGLRSTFEGHRELNALTDVNSSGQRRVR